MAESSLLAEWSLIYMASEYQNSSSLIEWPLIEWLRGIQMVV